MKLFYSTGTCSMAVVNAVEELGIPCELVEVSWKHNRNVEELNRLSPLGITPTLLLDDGRAITQNVAILEYLADPEAGSQIACSCRICGSRSDDELGRLRRR